MQAEKLIRLMKGETAYSEETLSELKNLLEEYPYFPAAQLLYTLNLQANKDTRFNAELRKSACYTGDRKKLFYLVESGDFPPEMIAALEEEEEQAGASAFDLIDFFLAEKEPEEPKFAIDYVSYLSTETSEFSETEIMPLKHQQAIDKFLEEDEKEPIRIKLKEPEENETATPLAEIQPEKEMLFSETLAKIYLKQKKYERSLEIIRKLSLLYPEKNRYFADQIRFLEKLIANTKK
ncbi:hypothetical protein AGMMS50262_13450 [Bacteroidia bacterium]|nr:hypothetical protein AGMMS50262_13450 [Bacteroidia bacterium]